MSDSMNDESDSSKKSKAQRIKELREETARKQAAERLEEQRKREKKLRSDAQIDKLVPEVEAVDISKLTPEQQDAVLKSRIAELEKKQALEAMIPGKSAEQILAESAAAEFEDRVITFFLDRWGMKARLSGGPVVITTVSKDSEGLQNGVRVGDVIFAVNDMEVELHREATVDIIRKGGPAKVHFKRLKGGHVPVLAGVGGDAQHAVKGDALSHSENIKLQAMLGQAKSKDTVTYSGLSNVIEDLTEAQVSTRATLVFSNCSDCTYTVSTICTKVYVQGCKNFVLHINSKVITSTIEIYKCQNVTTNFNTKCGTLQIDMCRAVNVNFSKQEYFYEESKEAGKNTCMIIWAGCHDLDVAIAKTDFRIKTSFEDMKSEYMDLVEERSQFRIRLKPTAMAELKFVQEKIIRLENGFFATMEEKTEFDLRQERNLKAMAESMGITVQPAKPKGVKCGPNEKCPQGSGKKYKKCCNRVDGMCVGKPDGADW